MRKPKISATVETKSPTLSAKKITQREMDELVNNKELLHSIERWLKSNEGRNNEKNRDLNLLGSIITEYLDSFILLGYNTEGERVVIKCYPTDKDSDAVMEFVKNVFFNDDY